MASRESPDAAAIARVIGSEEYVLRLTRGGVRALPEYLVLPTTITTIDQGYCRELIEPIFGTAETALGNNPERVVDWISDTLRAAEAVRLARAAERRFGVRR